MGRADEAPRCNRCGGEMHLARAQRLGERASWYVRPFRTRDRTQTRGLCPECNLLYASDRERDAFLQTTLPACD